MKDQPVEWPFLTGTLHICLLSLLPPPYLQSPDTHGYFSPPFHHPKEGIVPLTWLKQDPLLPHRFCEKIWIQLLQPEVATEPRITMIVHWLKYLEIYYFTDFAISNDTTATSLVASGNFRDSQEINIPRDSHQHLRQERCRQPLFSNTFGEEPFLAALLLAANVSPFWMQETPLVLHRVGASAPGNTFPVILEVQSFS